MRTRTLCETIVLGALVTLGLPLGAQTVRVRADIPFEFHVGHESLPAGTYTITNAANEDVLQVRSSDGAGANLAVHRSKKDDSGQTVLVFRRYGDRYFLGEIKAGWSAVAFEASPTKIEKELAKSAKVRREDYQIVAKR